MTWLLYIIFSICFISAIVQEIAASAASINVSFLSSPVIADIVAFVLLFLQIIFSYGLAKTRNWARISVLVECNLVLINLSGLAIYHIKSGTTAYFNEQFAFISPLIVCVIIAFLLIHYFNTRDIANNFLENRRELKCNKLKRNNEVINYILPRSHNGLGNVFRLKGEEESAAAHFESARKLGFGLSEAAIRSVAKHYAGKGLRTEEAIDTYIDYIKLASSYDENVFFILKQICYVDEATALNKRKEKQDLNKRVLKADPRINWAHFYLALAYFLDGQPEVAAKGFKKRLSIEPDNPLGYYWAPFILMGER